MASPLRTRDLLAVSPVELAGAALRGARRQVRETLESRFEDPAFVLAWARCVSVPGWLDRDAARLLFGLAAHGGGDGRIVEIGSYLGRSTILLALADAGTVVAVDPHAGELVAGESDVVADTYPLFLRNLETAGVVDRVEPRRETSLEAAREWKEPLRLLYLDGLHHYEAVREDVAAWAPHVLPGGFVVFDDYAVEGVQRAVAEAQRDGLLPPGVVSVGESAIVGVSSPRELRPYLLPGR
jgi:predicted O-methyltransferase YrrM